MSIGHSTVLRCDIHRCPAEIKWHGKVPKYAAEESARNDGWRKDKLGQNICPAHPKLKGASNGSS